jgi:hypothetical protein
VEKPKQKEKTKSKKGKKAEIFPPFLCVEKTS